MLWNNETFCFPLPHHHLGKNSVIFLLIDNSQSLLKMKPPKYKVPNTKCKILISLYGNTILAPQMEPAGGMMHFYFAKQRVGETVLPSHSFCCFHPPLPTSYPAKTLRGCRGDGSTCANRAWAWRTEFGPWNPQWKERIDGPLSTHGMCELAHTHTMITYP